MRQKSQLADRHSHTSDQTKFQFSHERVKCGIPPPPHTSISQLFLLRQFEKETSFYSFTLKLLIFQHYHRKQIKSILKRISSWKNTHSSAQTQNRSFVMFLPVNMPLTTAKEKTTRNFQTHCHADSSVLHWLAFLYLPHQRFQSSARALGKQGRI